VGATRLRSGSSWSTNTKLWASIVACLLIAQIAAAMVLPKSYRLTAITASIDFLLMISAALAFARNAFSNGRRQLPVWVLLASGYTIQAASHLLWMHWQFIVRQIPVMSLGDAGVYLAWTSLILAFALRPHVELTTLHKRLGTLDLLLLLSWGLYLYLFLVIPWQYFAADPQSYGMAYKYLALAQDAILLSIVLHGWLRSRGRWRYFYSLLTTVVALDTVMEYFFDTFTPLQLYLSGNWYNSTITGCLAGMTFAALIAYRLEPVTEYGDPASERYWRWTARLASPVTLVLPLLAAWTFFDHNLPVSVWKFRIVLSLAGIVLLGLIGFVKQFRLQNDLAKANQELLEASLTDLLTGVRNRRFFAHSIHVDVQNVLRSFSRDASAELRNRDLVFYLIDVDNFKPVNDRFGHKIGDQILVEVARRISSASRLSDAVIRWGGEEFLLLSRYTDRQEAHVLANRVLTAVGAKHYRVDETEIDLRITCSMGWAPFPWNRDDPRQVPHDEVIAMADQALYQAKKAGKNRAVGLLPISETSSAANVREITSIDRASAATVITVGPQIEERTMIAIGARAASAT
jgi:diguanylate cyclase (GGDEF)-like protein